MPIVVLDFGESRIVHPSEHIFFHPTFGLSGTPLAGQTIFLDVHFSGDQFIRFYTAPPKVQLSFGSTSGFH